MFSASVLYELVEASYGCETAGYKRPRSTGMHVRPLASYEKLSTVVPRLYTLAGRT